MRLLIAGIIIFFGSHSVIIFRPRLRDAIIERFGVSGNRVLMSLLSLLGLVLIIWGYGQARHDPIMIYYPPLWTRHLTLTLMLLSFILFAAVIFSGRIKYYVRHPVLFATLLWAVAHLLSNGTFADILLFGSFLIWSLADLWSLRYRSGEEIRLTASSAIRNDVFAVILGLLLYTTFVFGLHEWLIGIPPV